MFNSVLSICPHLPTSPIFIVFCWFAGWHEPWACDKPKEGKATRRKPQFHQVLAESTYICLQHDATWGNLRNICRFARKLCQFWFLNQCELLTLLHPNHNLLLVSGAKDRQRMMDHGGPQDKIDHSLLPRWPSVGPPISAIGSWGSSLTSSGKASWPPEFPDISETNRFNGRQMSRAEGHCKGQRCAKSLSVVSPFR